jgi:repressor LexA
MIDVGINDGDIIIVKSQQSAENGQIVAALVNNECATVKRFFKDEKGVRLHPENSAMSDIYPEELTILGIVVGLIRTDIR